MPVQANTFEAIYEGNNIVARDLTGSGKTLGFCLPLVEKFREEGYFASSQKVRFLRAVILAPTRELALQVSNELKKLRHFEKEFNVITVYGGVPIQDQERQLKDGVEFFVGTTGRVLDHIERRNIDFKKLKAVVLDEADQMLNQGFQEDVDKIMAAIKDSEEQDKRKPPQFILFSATIPSWV